MVYVYVVAVQADKLIRELQSSNRLLKSELQATATSFKQALHVAQTMLDTGAAPAHAANLVAVIHLLMYLFMHLLIFLLPFILVFVLAFLRSPFFAPCQDWGPR